MASRGKKKVAARKDKMISKLKSMSDTEFNAHICNMSMQDYVLFSSFCRENGLDDRLARCMATNSSKNGNVWNKKVLSALR